MQNHQAGGLIAAFPIPRVFILIGILTIGAWLSAWQGRPPDSPDARWPREGRVFAVEGWTISPETVETANGVTYIQRTYRRADGLTAQLAVITAPEAKRIYRAGPEAPFLSNGYSVNPAPSLSVPLTAGQGAVFVRRGSELGLLLSAYGERRGQFGNGPQAWGLVGLDAILARPNDYYLARIFVSLDRLDSPRVQDAVALSETVFERLAVWYAE